MKRRGFFAAVAGAVAAMFVKPLPTSAEHCFDDCRIDRAVFHMRRGITPTIIENTNGMALLPKRLVRFRLPLNCRWQFVRLFGPRLFT